MPSLDVREVVDVFEFLAVVGDVVEVAGPVKVSPPVVWT